MNHISITKSTIVFFYFNFFLTQLYSSPRCDTTHLDICGREFLQGAIEGREIRAHWEGGNYLTGTFVLDSMPTYSDLIDTVTDQQIGSGIHHYVYASRLFPNGNVSVSQASRDLQLNQTMKYYFAGTWHSVEKPLPIVVPMAIIQKTPTLTPTLANQKAPTLNPTLVSQKAPTLNPTLVSQKTPTLNPTLANQKAPTLTPTLVNQKIPTLSPTKIINGLTSKIMLDTANKKIVLNYNPKLKYKVTKSKNIPSKNNLHKNTVSMQIAKLHYSKVNKIDESNINKYLISPFPGNNVKQNHMSLLVDHNEKVWRCNISGLGYRKMTSQHQESTNEGHAETMHFQNQIEAHINENISIQSACLISVSK